MPHGLGAVGSGTPSAHFLTALGQWVTQLLQFTASLPWGSGQWHSFRTLPHCLVAMGNRSPSVHCLNALGRRQWKSFCILPHCLGAVGSRTPFVHCLIALWRWVVEILPHGPSLPWEEFHWPLPQGSEGVCLPSTQQLLSRAALGAPRCSGCYRRSRWALVRL